MMMTWVCTCRGRNLRNGGRKDPGSNWGVSGYRSIGEEHGSDEEL
jgi:hypothetical protein